MDHNNELYQLWTMVHPIDRPTWEEWLNGIYTLPPSQKDKDFPWLAIEERENRAAKWKQYMTEKNPTGCKHATTTI